MNLINSIFDYKSYMPQGYCYLWVPEVMWTHIVADFTIALSCFIIAATTFYLSFKRKNLPFSWVLILFATFILLTGITHAVSLLTTWYPFYAFEATLKIITAAAGIGTAFMMFPLLPKLLNLFGKFTKDESKQNDNQN